MKRTMLALAMVLGAAACGERPEAAGAAGEPGEPVVYVASYPMKYITERLAGEMLSIAFPLPDDVEPMHWSPSPEVLREMQRASLIILNGADHEPWAERATLPRTRVLVTTRGMESLYIESAKFTHSHGPEGGHSHGGVIQQTWLEPRMAKAQAEAIADAMVKLLPGREVELRSNLAALLDDLVDIEDELRAAWDELEGERVAFSHPLYDHLARGYDIDAVTFVLEPDTVPSDHLLRQIADAMKERPFKVMFWEGAPEDDVAKAVVDEFGLLNAVFDVGQLPPPEGDYLDLMRRNVEQIRWVASQIGAGRE